VSVSDNSTPAPQPAGRFDYYPLRVARLVRETADASSIVLDIPASLRELFSYQSGQYLTLRTRVAGETLERCYSLSSAPSVDNEVKVTVKAVEKGRMSNWVNRELSEGSTVEVMPPAGRFCLRDNNADLLLFSGGSGITPCISILKTALAGGSRKVRMLYANRDRASVIFAAELEQLQQRYPDRFELIHNLDVDQGFVDAAKVKAAAAGMTSADCFICGPGPFMDIVEKTLLELGYPREKVLLERFASDGAVEDDVGQLPAIDDEAVETINIVFQGKTRTLSYKAGDTLLESARREGLRLPFSCRQGNCATCIAKVTEGSARMKINNVLTDDEVKEGYILACQAVPTAKTVTVKYD
jgi:3-ketosteroid 9alpha-monooxygenase subunit B